MVYIQYAHSHTLLFPKAQNNSLKAVQICILLLGHRQQNTTCILYKALSFMAMYKAHSKTMSAREHLGSGMYVQ